MEGTHIPELPEAPQQYIKFQVDHFVEVNPWMGPLVFLYGPDESVPFNAVDMV